jgi:predicted transcriptional regulator
MSEQTIGQGMTLKERMDTRKENFMLRVDTHTDMIGGGLSKITPLMTQATSALCVGYSSYEGVNMYFNAHWIVAVLVGLVAGIATEGIGFIAVDERDKAEAHNRRTPDPTQQVSMAKGNAYVAGSFLITMAIVAAFESIPAIIRYGDGSATLAEVLFRCGLLVFPFLSRLGANLFAFRAVRESVDTLSDDQEIRRLKLTLAKQELIAKSTAKIEKVSIKQVSKPVETSAKVETMPVSSPATTENNDSGNLQETIEKAIVRFLKNNPGAKLDAIAVHADTTKGNVSKKISSLVEIGVLHEERQGKRRVVTVNGNHEEYLAS